MTATRRRATLTAKLVRALGRLQDECLLTQDHFAERGLQAPAWTAETFERADLALDYLDRPRARRPAQRGPAGGPDLKQPHARSIPA